MTILELLRRRTPEAPPAPAPSLDAAAGAVPIDELTYRRRARIVGRIRSMRVQPWAGVATLECTVVDDTAGVVVVFLGRRHVPGIELGTRLVVEGMVGDHRGRLAILNPDYELLALRNLDH